MSTDLAPIKVGNFVWWVTWRSKYMAQIPNGRLVKGQYKPKCRDCAIYFSTAVYGRLYLNDPNAIIRNSMNQSGWQRWGRVVLNFSPSLRRKCHCTFHSLTKMKDQWYCWWKKSGDHQLRLVVYPIISITFLHLRWLALGFLKHQQYH